MAPDSNDEWMKIAPLDRLADSLALPPRVEPAREESKVHFSLHLKGREAIFIVSGSDETVEAKFRYRPRAGAWQLLRREGSRWVVDGPPNERINRLLEQIVLVMQGSNPRDVFEV